MKEEIEKLRRAVDYIGQILWSFEDANCYIRLQEILNPPEKDEFLECDTCRAKPGSPTLCKGCLHNRDLITNLKK